MKVTLAITIAALAAAANAQGIAETVVAGGATTLAKVVTDLGLLDTLATLTGDVTIFAPTNKAFEDLAAAGANLSDTSLVTSVVSYHVVPGKTYLPTPGNTPLTTFLKAANGLDQVAVVSSTDAGVTVPFRVSSAAKVVDSKPVNGGKGIVHFVDTVLLPPQDIATVATAAKLTSLVETIQAAGLLETVVGLKNVTIFAPTNEAFAAIADVAKTLTKEQLQQVLSLHIVPTPVYSNAIVAAKSIPSVATLLKDQTVAAALTDGAVTIAGPGNAKPAKVVAADVTFDAGVVHVIDTVLLPTFAPLPATTSAAPVKTTPATPATTSKTNLVYNGASSVAPAGFAAAAVAVAALFL
ncbi:hypothetical protein HDU96_004670 [Phlyctochytrium bullatum]|nr:hypothetical protein HDU96_004670 [Phlyctochytrium bullatum]